jgi:hypothetical protein
VPIHALGHPLSLIIAFTGMVYHGVFKQFPRLRMGFLEGGAGWVTFWMDRLDRSHAYHIELNLRGKYNGPSIEEVPSDYLNAAPRSNAWHARAATMNNLLVDMYAKRLDVRTRRERLGAYLRSYISLAHREAPADGCVIPALSADVARSGPAVRQIYQARMAEFIGKIAPLMKGWRAAQEKRAWSLLSMMVGAMLIARAMPDKDQAAKVVDAALESALDSIGE